MHLCYTSVQVEITSLKAVKQRGWQRWMMGKVKCKDPGGDGTCILWCPKWHVSYVVTQNNGILAANNEQASTARHNSKNYIVWQLQFFTASWRSNKWSRRMFYSKRSLTRSLRRLSYNYVLLSQRMAQLHQGILGLLRHGFKMEKHSSIQRALMLNIKSQMVQFMHIVCDIVLIISSSKALNKIVLSFLELF